MAFEPKFEIVRGVNVCADKINQPHEDYPSLVEKTAFMIHTFADLYMNEGALYAFDLKMAHKVLFEGLVPSQQLGSWRTEQNYIRHLDGTIYAPPPPHMIDDEIEESKLFPVRAYPGHPLSIENTQKLKEWYKQFQAIHPFIDGNGRIGGIVVAVLSMTDGDNSYPFMMAPCQ